MADKNKTGALFGFFALIFALLTIFITTSFVQPILAVIGIVLGIFALLNKQMILGVVPIVVCVVFGLLF